MAKEKEFYVGITNPADARKNLLEASKEVIKSLQSYERIRHIRNEKAEQVSRFSNLMAELSSLIGQLKKELPEYSEEDLPKAKPQSKEESKEAKQPAKKSRASELQRLEKELSNIEQKLSGL